MAPSLGEKRVGVVGSLSELKLRTASAVVLGALALAATALGGWTFAALWLAAGAAVAAEWFAMTRAEPRRLLTGIACAGLAGLVLARAFSAGLGIALLICMLTALALAATAASGRARLWGVSGFVYAAVLTLVPLLVRERPDLGLWGVLWMFAVVWSTDVAAYFTGRTLGGPKLWPSVSPKKTWSGFAGGLVAGTACGAAIVDAALRSGIVPPAGALALAAAAALASVASQAGDLAESAMKRAFAVKDSGWLIPGHGGVMDRLDGFAAVTVLVGLAFAGARLVGQPGAATP